MVCLVPTHSVRLRQLDGAAHDIIHQAILFFIAQATDLHFDGWGFDTSPRA